MGTIQLPVIQSCGIIYLAPTLLFGIPKEERAELEEQAGELMKEGGVMIDFSTLNSYSFNSDVTATISYLDGYYIEVR